MSAIHAIGKLRPEFLQKLLERYAIPDPRVLVGPRVGEDATAIDFGKTYLVAKTDPITFATDEIGHYATAVNANDLAAMGAEPRWFLATILLPEGATTDALVEGIFAQLHRACRELGIALCGGHTEITHGLDRPIVVGTMLGEASPEGLVRTSGARAGDAIVLTKGIPIEATAIIAREKEEELRQAFPAEFIARCQGFLHDPGISVLKEARLARATAPIHAMHDPTEGGLATGLWELAEASGLGLEVEFEKVYIPPESALLCRHFGLDEWGAIASGALLIALGEGDAARVVEVLRSGGIQAGVIGRLLPREEGRWLVKGGRRLPLPAFSRDEIAKLFEG